MKKQLEIQQHVNLLDEAFLLLYYWINKDDMEEVIEKNSDYYLAESDKYIRNSDLLLQIYQYVKENFKGKKVLLEYYFKNRGDNFVCFAALAMLWNFLKYDNKVKSYEENFQNITQQQKVRHYALVIDGEETLNYAGELNDFTDLVKFIDTVDLDKDAKWEVIKIYHNQEKYYNEVSELLTQVMELIEGNFSEQITEVEQEFYKYWTEVENTDGIIDTIDDQLNITWEYSEHGVIVIPSLFTPFSLTISIAENKEDEKDIIRINALLDKRMAISGRKIKKDDVINVGKLLCDKSKVDILEFVSKKPCYGKEIANELELSTATISYHVNALLKIGFLKADINSNKVYYSINREKISAYLEDVKNYFIDL